MNNRSMVAGATGRTGQIIIKHLQQEGIIPHVLVRDLPAAQKLLGQSVIYHTGDVRYLETILDGMHEVDVIISAIGTKTPVGKNCPKHVDYEGVSNLVQAASFCGIERFILLSSIAVTHPDHPMNRFGKILDWKLKGEESLRQSNLDYAIIRPGALTDVPNGRRQLKFSQGDNLFGTISRTNVAKTCLHALKYPKKLGLTFEIIEADSNGQTDWHKQFSSLNKD